MGGRNLQDQGGQGTLICSKTKDSSIRGHSLVPWAGKDNGGYSGRGGRRAGASSCGVVPLSRGNKTLSAATIEQAIALIEGEEPVDLLFVDLKIQDDLEGGLKLAKKSGRSSSQTEGALHFGPSSDRWHDCTICQTIRLFTEALYSRRVCHDTPRQIRDRQSLKVKFGRAMWPNASQIEIWPWQPMSAIGT